MKKNYFLLGILFLILSVSIISFLDFESIYYKLSGMSQSGVGTANIRFADGSYPSPPVSSGGGSNLQDYPAQNYIVQKDAVDEVMPNISAKYVPVKPVKYIPQQTEQVQFVQQYPVFVRIQRQVDSTPWYLFIFASLFLLIMSYFLLKSSKRKSSVRRNKL